IAAVHATPQKCVIAVTGGGASAVAELLAVPGASRTLLEAVIPYDEQSLAEFLGRWPEQFCSADMAAEMARRAFERARWLAPGEPVVGVGCTASLATDRPKRGDHRVFVAVRTDTETRIVLLTLAKGARVRVGEERVAAALLLNTVAEAFGIADRVTLPL